MMNAATAVKQVLGSLLGEDFFEEPEKTSDAEEFCSYLAGKHKRVTISDHGEGGFCRLIGRPDGRPRLIFEKRIHHTEFRHEREELRRYLRQIPGGMYVDIDESARD